jgi:hypothetical protein
MQNTKDVLSGTGSIFFQGEKQNLKQILQTTICLLGQCTFRALQKKIRDRRLHSCYRGETIDIWRFIYKGFGLSNTVSDNSVKF